jgi:hypothetical protein
MARRVRIACAVMSILFRYPFIDRLMASCLERLVPVTPRLRLGVGVGVVALRCLRCWASQVPVVRSGGSRTMGASVPAQIAVQRLLLGTEGVEQVQDASASDRWPWTMITKSSAERTSFMTGPPARRCLTRLHGGPSASHLTWKCSSRTDKAMLASSGDKSRVRTAHYCAALPSEPDWNPRRHRREQAQRSGCGCVPPFMDHAGLQPQIGPQPRLHQLHERFYQPRLAAQPQLSGARRAIRPVRAERHPLDGVGVAGQG